LYHYEVIADYCLICGRKNGHFAFSEHSIFGGLEASYTVYLRFIGNLIVDFLFVLIELFSLGVTAEALYDWKLAFLKGVGRFQKKFHVEGDVPNQPFFYTDG